MKLFSLYHVTRQGIRWLGTCRAINATQAREGLTHYRHALIRVVAL
jgi:hypothetical protein